jgi:hypothetical protein
MTIFEDDELQREEMEEKEMEEKEIEEMEMEEKEMEKEREEDVKVEQRKEEGELPFWVPKPPFSNQQGLLVLAACQPMMIQHILSLFVVVSKSHEMNI